MSYIEAYKIAQRINEEFLAGKDTVANGLLDRWIESLADAMADSVVSRGAATSHDMFIEYDSMKARDMSAMMLAYGIPLSIVISNDVAAVNHFIAKYHDEINRLLDWS